jgi:hypothetical protein
MADIDNLKGGTKRVVEETEPLNNLRGSTQRVYVVGGGGGGSSLPDQSGHSGEFLTTDGTTASWGAVSQVPDTTGATQGDVLTVDSGGNAVWQAGGGGGGLPSQTGNAGKFLTTDGTDASWSDKPLVNKDTTSNQNCIAIALGNTVPTGSNANSSVIIGGRAVSSAPYSVVIGDAARSDDTTGIAIGKNARVNSSGGVAIGGSAISSATGAIQIVASWFKSYTNSDANTFKVGNANGNYEIMSADGTIPAARHASLPAADGTYVLKLVIASGVPTLSWVAE